MYYKINQKKIKCKIFLTEMGWGPIVRESAICHEILKLKKINFTVQSSKNLDIIKNFFPEKTKIINKNNLIKYFSTSKGGVDYVKTRKYYHDYNKLSVKWFDDNLKDKDYDFFISDVCPEAFELASKLKIPCFGIGHFTWDWFFLQTIPNAVSNDILNLWKKFQLKASNFFFPPFTPNPILEYYKNHSKTNFIISHKIKSKKIFLKKNKIKILFLDSGDRISTPLLKKIINKNKSVKDFLIMHADNIGKFKETFSIKRNNFLGDYIPHADIIVGRAGFNTITELLYYNKPAIFLTSKNNPEINWNLSQMVSLDLAQSIDIDYLADNFELIIKDFIKFQVYEKKNISKYKNFSLMEPNK